jgi:PAS domain S-box-containing protein
MPNTHIDENMASAWLAAIVASSDDAIISKDLNGIITSWNAGAERTFGYTADEAIGQPVLMLIPDDRKDEEPDILGRIRNGERIDHYETVRQHRDGRMIDISLTVSPIRAADGTVIGASKIARDFTEHNRVVAAEHEAEMMHRLVERQESERKRLARDLHDHIGQQMTGFRLRIERLAWMLDQDKPALAEVNELRGIAAKIDSDLAFLSWELRPTEIDALGLTDALKSFTTEWSRQYGVEADFQSIPKNSNGKLPDDLETSLYRITQEALNNVVKHASAQKVSVFFHKSKTGVSLLIEDDGKGFFPEIALKRPGAGGLGITGMRERTQLLNGYFGIESSPGKGTTVFCRLPVKSNGKAAQAKAH